MSFQDVSKVSWLKIYFVCDFKNQSVTVNHCFFGTVTFWEQVRSFEAGAKLIL